MLIHLVRKEMLLNFVSFRFLISVALLFALVVGSMQMMASNHARRVEDYSAAKTLHKEDLANTSSRMQFEAFGVTEDPRPTLLGILAIGLEPQMSRSFTIPGFAMEGGDNQGNRSVRYVKSKLEGIVPEGSKYSNPLFALFQPPDFLYVVNITLSLLALLFAFDAVSGERENQTLKLMLVNSVPRDAILIGKCIGGTLSILLPFTAAFLLGVGLTAARPDVSLTGDALWRVLLVFGVSALYVVSFYLLGLTFSTFTDRSSTALILSLFAWVTFVLVIPNLAPVVSRRLVPVSQSDAVGRETERLENEIWKESREQEGEERRKYREKAVKELPGKIEALENQWLRKLERQASAAMNFSRISPSAAYVYAASLLSGTGVADYYRQRDEILRHREAINALEKSFVSDDKTKPIPQMYVKLDVERLPHFKDRRLSLAESVNGALPDIAILAAFPIVLFMTAFLKFLRCEVQ